MVIYSKDCLNEIVLMRWVFLYFTPSLADSRRDSCECGMGGRGDGACVADFEKVSLNRGKEEGGG